MARIPYLGKAEVAPEYHDLLANPVNLHRALISSPKALRGLLMVGRYLRHESPLEPRLRELAVLQVAYLTGSIYEWTHHLKLCATAGVGDDDIQGIVAASEGRPNTLDRKTNAVLQVARELTLDAAISDDTFADIRRFLETQKLIDLVVTVCHYNGLARLIRGLQIDLESDYQPWLDRYPVPARAYGSRGVDMHGRSQPMSKRT